MSKRAERRAHKRRMKRKATEIYPTWPKAYKWADHIKGCSCEGCCNVRRSEWLKEWDRLTRQEQNAFLDYEDQIEDFDEDGR